MMFRWIFFFLSYDYDHGFDCHYDLISATVAETTVRCTTEVVDIKRVAVSHFNVGVVQTTV